MSLSQLPHKLIVFLYVVCQICLDLLIVNNHSIRVLLEPLRLQYGLLLNPDLTPHHIDLLSLLAGAHSQLVQLLRRSHFEVIQSDIARFEFHVLLLELGNPPFVVLLPSLEHQVVLLLLGVCPLGTFFVANNPSNCCLSIFR